MAFVSNVPVPQVTTAGCQVPDFPSIYAGLVADFQGIYGADVVLDPSTLDGQWLGILATAFKNYADSFLSAYNAFSPQSAQGAGLSSVVKVNGLAREGASTSTVDVRCVGIAGSMISGPQIRDPAGNLWSMPDFSIPFAGEIVVTATCGTIGAIPAPAGGASGQGGYWIIATPQYGWQSVNNVAAATLGQPVESDAALRIRQAKSTMLPSQTVLAGIVADILTIPGVVACNAFENDSNVVDVNGIPPHGTAFVVDGGDATAIATAIALKKTQGSPTYGTTAVQILSGRARIPRTISFFRPIKPPITVYLTLKALPGYTLAAEAALKQAVADWINALGPGVSIAINDVYDPVLTFAIGGSRPFKVLGITIARGGVPGQAADVPIAFNEQAFGLAANVNVAAS